MLSGPRPITTLLVVKPDAVQRHLSKLLRRVSQEGFKVVGLCLETLSPEQAELLMDEQVLQVRRLTLSWMIRFNSLAPGRFKWNFGWVIFKLALMTDGWVISCKIPLSWMSLNLTDDKSALVQVMAWCCQLTSHYLSQCWPRSLSPYGINRPQRVNSLAPGRFLGNFR